MGYSSVSEVRVLSGVTEEVLADAEIESLIVFSDQQIDDDINPSDPSSIRIKHLSALLTAVKIFTRPDFRGGFSVGDVSFTNQQIEEALSRWMAEIRRIYAYYGKTVQDSPSTFRRV